MSLSDQKAKIYYSNLWLSLSDERGSVLMTTLFISLALTLHLLLLISSSQLQSRFAQQKADYLQAKYYAESAGQLGLTELQAYWQRHRWPRGLLKDTTFLFRRDTAHFSHFRWGAYIAVVAAAAKRSEHYSLDMLAGQLPSAIFNYALILPPAAENLVVCGDTQIRGDVLMGPAKVTKGTIGLTAYTGDRLVYGKIQKSALDHRPAINRSFVEEMRREYHAILQSQNFRSFATLLADSNPSLKIPPRDALPVYYITNEQLNRRPWKIKGPGILVAREPLFLRSDITLSNYLLIISSKTIHVSSLPRLQKVILFSPQKIILRGITAEEIQVFSETGITLEDARLSYPSLTVVYSKANRGEIRLRSRSRLAGTVLYLARTRYPSNPAHLGKVVVEKNARIDGVLYSDNLVDLSGTVNGTVITGRFYLYQSPMVYFNWIYNGTIRRDKLNANFRLPLLFDVKDGQLSPVNTVL